MFGFLQLILSCMWEAKVREAVSYSSSPGHLGPLVTEVIVWLPVLVIADSDLTLWASC